MRTIDGRYELLREAGRGGMGTVYRARDLEAGGKAVALKLFDRGSVAEPRRVAREIAALTELSHPHIVSYVAHGQCDDGGAYLVMQWLEGEDLAVRLTRGTLAVDEVLTVGRSVAAALAAAHQRGLVHRDIKPGNVFLVGGSLADARVIDFGLARMTDASALTTSGVALGTPLYMAPEQIRGHDDIDERADVYALGCVLYECIAGKAPSEADHPLAAMMKALYARPTPLREIARCPVQLDELVTRMLALAADQRPADGAAVVAALARVQAALGGKERAEADAGAEVSSPRHAAVSRDERRFVCVAVGAPRAALEQLHGETQPPSDDTAQPAVTPQMLRAARCAVEPLGADVQILGDAVMGALLQSDEPPAEQASRAARCALEMRAALPRFRVAVVSGRVSTLSAAPLGELFERVVGELKRDVRGAVAVDDGTASLLAGRFAIVSGPDAAGKVLSARVTPLPPPRTLCGRVTRCLGRERELVQMLAAANHCFEASEASALLVTGAAGAGKSRLLDELVARIVRQRPDVAILGGRAELVGAGMTFGALSTALRTSAGIAVGRKPTAQRASLLARLAHVGQRDRARIATFLAQMCSVQAGDDADGVVVDPLAQTVRQPHRGADDAPLSLRAALRAARLDARLMADQQRAAFVDWLLAEARQRAVLLLLDDIHWGDAPTMSLVDHALARLHDQRLLVVAAGRPQLHQRFPKLWEQRGPLQISLRPLPQSAARELGRDVLGDGIDEASLQQLVERADGNVFFLEELIRAAHDGAAAPSELPQAVLATSSRDCRSSRSQRAACCARRRSPASASGAAACESCSATTSATSTRCSTSWCAASGSSPSRAR